MLVVVVAAMTKTYESNLKKEDFIWGHSLRRGTMRHGREGMAAELWVQRWSHYSHNQETESRQEVGPPGAHYLQQDSNGPQPFKIAPPARDHMTNASAYGRRRWET